MTPIVWPVLRTCALIVTYGNERARIAGRRRPTYFVLRLLELFWEQHD